MTQDNEKITVLMSVFNERATYLKRSIDSILCQTYPAFEFLIINDGSTDEVCSDLLQKYAENDKRICLIKNEKNLGLAQSLNKGLKKARGEYIVRMDSDDISALERIETQLKFMSDNPSCVLCGSWAYLIDEENNIIGEKKLFTDYSNIKRKLLFFNFFTHSSLFFKKDAILKNGGYNEKIKKSQDYDLLLRISAHYPIFNIGRFLCFHRLHSKSISAKGKKKQEWYAIIARLKAVFQYGYPKKFFWKIIPSFFYFIFVPYALEKIIFKFLWKR